MLRQTFANATQVLLDDSDWQKLENMNNEPLNTHCTSNLCPLPICSLCPS